MTSESSVTPAAASAASSDGTRTRVLTALAFGIPVVALVWWGPTWAVAIVVAAVLVIGLREFFDLGEKCGMSGYRIWTMICAALVVLAQLDLARIPANPGPSADPVPISLELIFFVFVAGCGCLLLLSRRPFHDGFRSVAISSAAFLFFVLPGSYLVGLHALEKGGLLFVLAMVWAGDSLAFFVGRRFGRHKMSPMVSPNKTWEGAAGNLVGACIVALVAIFWVMDEMPRPLEVTRIAGFFTFPCLVSIAGQLGDMLESAYKRAAGVKDSGNIFPGHGGMLDRIDALIFAAPAAWFWVFLTHGK